MNALNLSHMTTEQVAEYLAKEDTIMIPVGSCEQHGPHLPLGTDTLITAELARRLAAKLNYIVAPMIPIGLSDQHLAWPGSLTLRVETIQAILADMADALFPHGFRKLIFLYFHTKNKIAVDAAAWQLKAELGDDARVMVINAFESWRACSDQIFGPRPDPLWLAHGGEGETACVMALGYQVDGQTLPERIENEAFLKISRSKEAYSIIQNLKRYTPGGTWGEPRLATAETGERIFETVSQHIAELIPQQWENRP